MGHKNYQETVLHDKNIEGWGESSVFHVEYPNGTQECRKEYDPSINYDLLKDYHLLHNHLAEYSASYDVSFSFEEQEITTLKFTVLPLGDLFSKTSSLASNQEVCVSTVPYIGGYGFDQVARTSPQAMRFLCKTLDQFAKDLCKKYPDLFTAPDFLLENLCSVNIKCFVEGNQMTLRITDLFGRIRQLYEICDEVQLGLLGILQDRKIGL